MIRTKWSAGTCRLWIATGYPHVAAGEKPLEPAAEMSDRVRYALDMADIAVAERVARLMGSDLPPAGDAHSS